jgi:NADPH-dependent ferric siderophore reductase
MDKEVIWAKNLVAANDFHYSKIEAENHFPIVGKHLVFLGDQTGIGHFCSLQQLAIKNTQISYFITFNDLQTAEAFSENCWWLPLQAVSNYDDIYKQTEYWVIKHQTVKENFVLYVVGSAELIVTLRKLLRTYRFADSHIKSKGFWH